MDLKHELSNPTSLGYINSIVQFIFDNPGSFTQLFELIFIPDKNIAWRAAWACDKISRKYPEWFTDKHVDRITSELLTENHKGVRRSLLCILDNLKFPENLPVELINNLFEWMVSPRVDVSHQALSMRLLYKLSLKEPDFKAELTAYLENVSNNDYTPGFNCTRKKILKLLNKRNI